MKENKRFFGAGLLVIFLISVPYLIAVFSITPEMEFGGFLLNPIDGYSYLAKMQQGYSGTWRFVLPYTSEPGEGAYLFLFYLGLGHLSRILGISNLILFHLFRILGSVALLLALYLLIIRLFDDRQSRLIGFVLATMGSGLGWLGILAGYFSSDFWVAEAYPFLSMYTNPHFPLGLAILIFFMILDNKNIFLAFVLGTALAIIQPFAVVIAILVKTGSILLELFQQKELIFQKLIKSPALWNLLGFGISGGLLLVYQYLSILADPVLANWNDQNLTPSPALVDFLLSFSPVLPLAIFGMRKAWRKPSGRMLIIWCGISMLLLLTPWNLQRRFLTGLYVPLAVLSIFGLKGIINNSRFNFKSTAVILLILVLPTNLIVILSGMQAISVKDPAVYLSRGQIEMLDWINQETKRSDLILADADDSLLIPAFTGRRVVYGHPFETVNAKVEQAFQRDVFEMNNHFSELADQIRSRQINYLIIDGEQSGGNFNSQEITEEFPLIFQSQHDYFFYMVNPIE
jgi:hypothetical protein